MVFVLTALAWAVSLLLCIALNGERRAVGLGYGVLEYFGVSGAGSFAYYVPGLEIARVPERSPWNLRFGFRLPRFRSSLAFTPGGRVVIVPLWGMLLIVAIPTAFLWYRDRRPAKGHCQTCRYDLTGNMTGVCSECGELI